MIKNCDICKSIGFSVQAVVDAKTKAGYWAYLCDKHNTKLGLGIPALTTILADLPND